MAVPTKAPKAQTCLCGKVVGSKLDLLAHQRQCPALRR